jgi:hypothetical protein
MALTIDEEAAVREVLGAVAASGMSAGQLTQTLVRGRITTEIAALDAAVANKQAELDAATRQQQADVEGLRSQQEALRQQLRNLQGA